MLQRCWMFWFNTFRCNHYFGQIFGELFEPQIPAVGNFSLSLSSLVIGRVIYKFTQPVWWMYSLQRKYFRDLILVIISISLFQLISPHLSISRSRVNSQSTPILFPTFGIRANRSSEEQEWLRNLRMEKWDHRRRLSSSPRQIIEYGPWPWKYT